MWLHRLIFMPSVPPLLRGRFFTEDDKQGAPLVLIINSAMAKMYWAQ